VSSNLRQTTREYVYFRSRDKDGGQPFIG